MHGTFTYCVNQFLWLFALHKCINGHYILLCFRVLKEKHRYSCRYKMFSNYEYERKNVIVCFYFQSKKYYYLLILKKKFIARAI